MAFPRVFLPSSGLHLRAPVPDLPLRRVVQSKIQARRSSLREVGTFTGRAVVAPVPMVLVVVDVVVEVAISRICVWRRVVLQAKSTRVRRRQGLEVAEAGHPVGHVEQLH